MAGAPAAAAWFLLGDRRPLVIGPTSAGHRLIEARCESCHTPWRGPAAARCAACHAPDMEGDHHAAAKFANVARWADIMNAFDVRDCVLCHVEHREAPLGFTEDAALCARCHGDIETVVPSHRGLGDPARCLDCHNYHFEGAIVFAEAARRLADPPPVPAEAPRARTATASPAAVATDAPAAHADPEIVAGWRASAHARAGVSCASCHGAGPAFVLRPDERRACAGCHALEVSSFHQGKHGARAGVGLGALAPGDPEVALPMRAQAPGRQGCAACHGVHRLDLERARAAACLGCHADEHSRSFVGSPHERRGGPTCAGCHLPARTVGEARVTWHNNSFTMRPAERMLSEVCVRCHALGFAWAALRSREQVRRNFDGRAPFDPVVEKYVEMVRAKAGR